MYSVHTASSDLGERVASEEEQDANTVTEQKLSGERRYRRTKKLAQLVLFAAFEGVIYFLSGNSTPQQLI